MAACFRTMLLTDWDFKDGQTGGVRVRRTSRTYGVAPWSKPSPIWWDRICACFFAGSIPGRGRVTSAFISPARGTGSGNCSVPVDSPSPFSYPLSSTLCPGLGIGITNLVDRVTVAASDLSVAELREGATQLEAKVERLRPPLRRGARVAGLPDGFSKTESCNRSPARTSRPRLSLAPPQPERPSGPLSAG